MIKIKKILKGELKILFLLSLIAIVIGTIIYEIDEMSYKTVSQERFCEIALNKGISSFIISRNRLQISISPNEKYDCDFSSNQDVFKNNISEKLGVLGVIKYKRIKSFYEFGIPIIIFIVFGILFLNILILWFIGFYDLLKSEFEKDSNKWFWFISFLIVPFVTPLFYLFISANQKIIIKS